MKCQCCPGFLKILHCNLPIAAILVPSTELMSISKKVYTFIHAGYNIQITSGDVGEMSVLNSEAFRFVVIFRKKLLAKLIPLVSVQ